MSQAIFDAAGHLLVSVLVPCHNAEQFLAECLESALAQRHPRVEVIVVDDGSTDASLAVARGFEPRGVRVLTRENGGQSAALNTALAAASGDYIQFLDADDVLEPGKIAAQIARLDGADPSAVASGAWARFAANISETVFLAEPVWRDLSPVDWLVESWSGGGMMHVAAWLIPRRVVERAGPWNETLRWAANLDADFFTRALLVSAGCLFCPEARSFYRSGHPAMSGWRSRRSLEASLAVLLRTGEALLAAEQSPRTRRAFADNLQRFVYSTYPESPDLVAVAEGRIRELGGAGLPFAAGPAVLAVSRLCGWKAAKQLRRLAR